MGWLGAYTRIAFAKGFDLYEPLMVHMSHHMDGHPHYSIHLVVFAIVLISQFQ